MTTETRNLRNPLLGTECEGCRSSLSEDNAAKGLARQEARPVHRQFTVRVCDTCLEERNRETRIENAKAMIPESFAWAGFSAPELRARVVSTPAIAQASAAVLVPRVVFLGPAGSGKTSLACAAMRARYYATGEFFYFAPASTLAMARARHKLGAGDPRELIEALQAPVLLIDDLGFEKPGPTSVNDVETVIYERHLHARPTWVTTWMRSDKARERYGDGIARRLFEGATIIDCGGMP